MRPQRLRRVIVACVFLAGATPELSRAADPDWKAVEQALGKSGQVQAGDVYRVGMPRTDLAVTVKGVPVKAGFALGHTLPSSRWVTTRWSWETSSCSIKRCRR